VLPQGWPDDGIPVNLEHRQTGLVRCVEMAAATHVHQGLDDASPTFNNWGENRTAPIAPNSDHLPEMQSRRL